MRRSILVVSELVLVLCVVQSLAAQVPTLAPGTRIRLSTVDVRSKPLIGVVDSVRSGTIALRLSPQISTTVPISQVSQIEVSSGRRRPVWSLTAPFWLTAVAGGAGAILGYSSASDDDFFGRDFAAAVGAAGFGTVGFLVGSGLAIGVKEERWELVPSATYIARSTVAPSVYVAPASRGITLGMRAAF